MRILLLHQALPPETKASDERVYHVARELHRLGHQVCVLCAAPNRRSEEIFAEFADGRAIGDGIEIITPWILSRNSTDFLMRGIVNGSFALSSALASARSIGPVDIVLAQSPPLFVGLAGLLFARRRRARFVLNVSDLWPRTLIELGLMRNKFAVMSAQWLEQFLYRHADLIIGQSLGITSEISARFPNKRIVLSICGAAVRNYEDRNGCKDDHRSESQDFLVGFAGMHGRAQDLDQVLRAARILSSNRRIKFHFYGEGTEKARLIQLRDQLGLNHVTFHDSQPKSRMPAIVASFDVAMVPLREGELFRGTLPAKMYEAMAAGRPIVLAADGEARRMLEAAEGGICVPPQNPAAIAQAITRLYENPELARQLGQSGRRYAMEHLDWSTITKDLERELIALG